jgi:hypothetical protein
MSAIGDLGVLLLGSPLQGEVRRDRSAERLVYHWEGGEAISRRQEERARPQASDEEVPPTLKPSAAVRERRVWLCSTSVNGACVG